MNRKRLLPALLSALSAWALAASVPPKPPALDTGRSVSPASSPGIISADLSDGSGSIPHLNAAGTGWASFDTAQGTPAKGGMLVLYTPADSADIIAFPIQTGGASVTLRPGPLPTPTLPCSLTVTEPDLSSANAGDCFYRVTPAGDGIQIYYMGQFQSGGGIRYMISGLTPATGSATFASFDSEAVLPGSPPTPTAGRIPARLALVLDKSGSMKWSSHPLDPGCGVQAAPPTGCGPSRWEVLRRAVDALLTIAGAYLLPGDTVALAAFSSAVNPAHAIAPPVALDSAAITSIRGLIDPVTGINPGGNTSIGAGLRVVEPHVMPVAAGQRNQTVLLFTDGDQNRAPFVVFSASQVLINDTLNDPALGGPITAFAADADAGTIDARLCPFALRSDNPGDPLGTQFNDDIASRRCANVALTAVSVDPAEPELIEFFLAILNQTLIGDKLELAAVRSGQTVNSAGAPASEVSEPFVVSRDDVAFTVLVSWAELGAGLADLELEKDGVAFGAFDNVLNGRIDFREAHAAITLRQPFCNQMGDCVEGAGDWVVRFTPAFEVGNSFTYNVFVTVDNQTLASEFEAIQEVPGVGMPITLRATLREGGAPLTGLPDGSVTVLVARPDAGLGNVLSAGKVAPAEPSVDDQVSPAGLKALAMLNDPAQRAALLAALISGTTQTFTLTETDPGVYAATDNDVPVEGAYQIRFFVEGEAPGNAVFTRTLRLTRYVPVAPDPGASEASLVIDPLLPCAFAGGCHTVRLTPRDAAGNLLGPGKASLFRLTPGVGQLLEPATDNLDGSYSFKVAFAAPPTQDPTLDLYGVSIKLPLGQKGPSGKIWDWIRANCHWILLLLLILLLFVLLWMLIRRRRRPAS